MEVIEEFFSEKFDKQRSLGNEINYQEEYIGKFKSSTIDIKSLRLFLTKMLFSDNLEQEFEYLSMDEYFRDEIMPELFIENEYGENFLNCQQNSEHHKYTVFKHSVIVTKNVGMQSGFYDDEDMILLKWAAFLHDTGKPLVKQIYSEDQESFATHPQKSKEISNVILKRLGFTQDEIEIINQIVLYHDELLNYEDITYETVSDLVKNIDGDRHIFDLILEIKKADALSKKDEYRLEAMDTIDKILKIGLEIIKHDYYHIDTEKEKSPTETQLETKNSKTKELNNIIKKKDIVILFQPIVDLKNKRVFGYEAYSRTSSKKFESIVDLLNTAKEEGKLKELEKIMFEKAIEKLRLINGEEGQVYLFINISSSTVIELGRKYFEDICNDSRIVIELSHGNEEKEAVLHKVMEVKEDIAINICLDNYMLDVKKEIIPLKVVPDLLKIDMEITRDIDSSVKKQYALKNILTYTFVNNVKVIAEGIETKAELETIIGEGIEFAQGYLFSKPTEEIQDISEKIDTLIKLENISLENKTEKELNDTQSSNLID